MADQTIDYEELARRSRQGAPPAGGIDYGALADQARKGSASGTAAFGISREEHPILAAPLDFLQGAGTSVYNLARGASQVAHHVVNAIPELPAAPADETRAAQAGNVVGTLLTPVPGGAAERTAGWGVRALRTALQGGVMAGAQPVEGKPEDFWANKAKQVGTGAVVAPVVGGAMDLAGKGLAKVVNASTGNLPEDAAALIRQGKQHRVRLTYSDISRNPLAQKTEVAMESVPVVGMSSTRAAQQTEAKAAATAVTEARYDKLLNTEPGLVTDIEGAAQSGDVRAKNLLEQLHNAGNDPDKILQTSIGLGDFRTRQEAEHLYDRVETLVKQNNLPDVSLPGTAAAVKASLEEAEASKLPDRQLIGILKDIKAGISQKAGARPANPFPPGTALSRQFDAQPVAAQSANNDYGAMRQLRSDLGDKIRMYMSGDAAIIGDKGVGQLQRVKNALESDLSAFTEQSGVPEIQQAARTADQYYKTARVPFKDQMLAAAATDKEPDQIFQRFIQAGKGDRAQRFYEALDPKGQAAVRYKIVATAVDKATNEATGTFSPQKYFTSMAKLKDATQVFFRGQDQDEIDGFNNLMAHVTRAGQYAENPPTGQRVVPFLLGGGAVGALVKPALLQGGAVGAGALAVTKALFTTNAGKLFLLAASKWPPGSPKMEALVNQINKIIPVAAARAATMPAAGQQQDRPESGAQIQWRLMHEQGYSPAEAQQAMAAGAAK